MPIKTKMSKKVASAEREGLRVGKVASSGLSLSKPEYVVRQHPQIFDVLKKMDPN